MSTTIQRKTLATKLNRRLLRLGMGRRRRARSQHALRLGLVGLGGAAHWKLSEIVACPGARLHAICDSRREAIDSVLQRHRVPHVFEDYRALVELSDLDGVIIATPNALHCPIARAALAAGKHVLCEKPLAMNADEARQMVDAARDARRQALVHFPYRLSAEARFVRQLIAEGRLGRPYLLSIVYAHGGWYGDDGSLRNAPGVGGWRTNRELAGSGVLSDLGSHALDLARYWLGEADAIDAALVHQGAMPLACHAYRGETIARKPVPLDDDIHETTGGMDSLSGMGGIGGSSALVGDDPIDDTASYRVQYENGALGTFVNSRCYTGHGQNFVAELYGSRAALRFEPGQLHWYERATGWFEVAVPEHFARPMIDEFARACLGSEVGAATFQDGLHVQQLLDAALESNAQRCEVQVVRDRASQGGTGVSPVHVCRA